MRARFINENIDNSLKIYKNDDVYEAFQNSYFYTFRWSRIDSKLYNFKKIGHIGNNFIPTGTLVEKPHIQMILQLQEKIKSVNEWVREFPREPDVTSYPEEDYALLYDMRHEDEEEDEENEIKVNR